MPDLSPDHTQHSSTAKAHKPSPPDTLHPVETVCIHFDTFDNSPCSNSSLFVFHLSYVTDEKKVIDVESITLPLHILLSFLFSVFMCKQMLLAVFIIAVAFGTEAELQIWIIQFCSAADCAFMLTCASGPGAVLSLMDLTPEIPFSFILMRRISLVISCT